MIRTREKNYTRIKYDKYAGRNIRSCPGKQWSGSNFRVFCLGWKYFSNCFFGIDFRVYDKFLCTISVAVNVHPFEMGFIFWTNNMFSEAKSGEWIRCWLCFSDFNYIIGFFCPEWYIIQCYQVIKPILLSGYMELIPLLEQYYCVLYSDDFKTFLTQTSGKHVYHRGKYIPHWEI